MPPSSSGGVTIAEALNVLEPFGDLAAHGSASYTHKLAAAYQRAFIDRNAKLADPAFVKVPVEQLTSKGYAKALQPRSTRRAPRRRASWDRRWTRRRVSR